MVSRFFVGGDKRDRTADLLTASQALSQLSYTPKSEAFRLSAFRFFRTGTMDSISAVQQIVNTFFQKILRFFMRTRPVSPDRP